MGGGGGGGGAGYFLGDLARCCCLSRCSSSSELDKFRGEDVFDEEMPEEDPKNQKPLNHQKPLKSPKFSKMTNSGVTTYLMKEYRWRILKKA